MGTRPSCAASGRAAVRPAGAASLPRRLALAAVCAASMVMFLQAEALAQTYTWKNVQIVGGGFVPGIIFNEAEPGLVYARTDIGGAYRLDPATERWIPLTDWISFDDWNLSGIASLATDPVDPDRVYLAAGTYTNDWTDQNGAILRSTDRGATWQRTDLPFKLGGNMPGRSMGERLAVDPNKNSILYLGAPSGNGLWKSSDYGATWSEVTSFPNPGTYVQDPDDPWGYLNDIVGVVWVTFDKTTGSPGSATQTIYVGVADQGDCIYRSTDAGATWQAVPGQPTGFLPHHGVLAPTGVLYVPYSDTCGPYDGSEGDVWKCDTASGVWTRISPRPSDPDPNDDCYFGYGGLSVDAQNPNTLMVATMSSWWPDAIIWRSTDAGATWTQIWDWTRYPARTFRYTQDISAAPWLDDLAPDPGPRDAEVNPKLGWMVGDLEIDPFNSDRMMYGTGATIYGCDDLTVWDADGQITIEVKAVGLEETSIMNFVSPPSGAPLVSAMRDIFGFCHLDVDVVPETTHAEPYWSTTDLDFAELNPSYMVRVGPGNPDTTPAGPGAAYSNNGGATWTSTLKGVAGITDGGTVAVGANGANLVWAPVGAGVYYSTTNGGSWVACAGVPAEARVASDRVNGAKFYAFKDGTLYVSTDGGATFSASAAGGFPLSSAVIVKALPGVEGDVWLAGGAEGDNAYGIWHSTDSGATFAKLANVEEADSIGFGKPATGQTHPAIYSSAQVAGVRGIFRSTDAGATWERINDDQHQYAHTGGAITGDPRIFGRVYVATNGRGIIYGDESGPPPTPPDAPSGLDAVAVSSSQIDLSWVDNATNEDGFSIERKTGAGGTYEEIDTVGANVTSYPDTGLAPLTTYYYRVRAFNAGGYSSYSNEASATTLEGGGGDTVHVDSITVTIVYVNPVMDKARAEVVIVDSGGAPVEGATVTGSFTGDISHTGSDATDQNGLAVIETAGAKGLVNVTFCVTDVTHATLTYEPGDNVETCDST